jgi:hypothetical protein
MLRVPLAAARLWAWAKQGLGPDQHSDVPAAVAASAGIYGTAPTGALSAAARVSGFRLVDLEDALYERQVLVRVGCLRGSAFAIPVERLATTFPVNREWRIGAQRSILQAAGVDDPGYRRLSTVAEAVLGDGRGRTTAELAEAVGAAGNGAMLAEERRAFRYVVALMSTEGRLVVGRSRGTWRSNLHEVHRPEDWIPGVPWWCDRSEALEATARWYLRAYGPATAADFGWWSGVGPKEAAKAFAALSDEVEPVEVAGLADPTGVVVPADEVDGLVGAGGLADGVVRLLPMWDVLALRGRDRRRLVGPDREGFVYDRSGNPAPVVAVDGEAAGLWELEGDDRHPTVAVGLFEPAGPRSRRWRAIVAEAERVAAGLGLGQVAVRAAEGLRPLADGGQNSFMRPIHHGESRR